MTKETHRARSFRVHALAESYTLHDVWSIPIEADPARDTFADFFRLFRENGTGTDSRIANALFRLRFALGRLFRLDPPGPAVDAFKTVYLIEDEALLSIENKTVEALLHLGWVDGPNGRKTATLAVYVKSRGWFTGAYMALIWPFRHFVVYPAWLSRIRHRWEARAVPA
jgi:Protein of unknown function (DUF2867)